MKAYILDKPSTSKTTSQKYVIDCSNKLKNSKYTTKDWFEIKKFIDATNNDNKNKIILGILDKHKQCVAKIGGSDTLYKEYEISKKLFSDNILKTYCFFKCHDDYREIDGKNKYLCRKEGNKMSILLMEYCELGNMREFDFYKYQDAFYSCMKQVILSTIELCHNQGFYHNDLHAGNVLIKKTKIKEIEYIIGDNIYKIKTNGYKAVIMDYENAVLVNKPKTEYYNNEFLQKDIQRFVTDIMLNSKKITFTDIDLFKKCSIINIEYIINAVDNIKLEKFKSLEELLKERQMEYYS